MEGDRTTEQIGHDNATFRAANERLDAVAAAQDRAPEEPLPFVCECADPTCTQVIRVPLVEYRRVRSDPRRFLTAPAHETDAVVDDVQVVEQHDGYFVTENTGPAAAVGERLVDSGDGE